MYGLGLRDGNVYELAGFWIYRAVQSTPSVGLVRTDPYEQPFCTAGQHSRRTRDFRGSQERGRDLVALGLGGAFPAFCTYLHTRDSSFSGSTVSKWRPVNSLPCLTGLSWLAAVFESASLPAFPWTEQLRRKSRSSPAIGGRSEEHTSELQ